MARHCCLFLVFALMAAGAASGQSNVTSLRGTITDQSGAHIPHATVQLQNDAAGIHKSTNSDSRGEYQFQQIEPGIYRIDVAAGGFAVQSKTAELLVDEPATINFNLSISLANTVVEVNGIAQTLNTADASIGNAVNNATIEALPMEGRNVADLLSLQPGVLYLGRQIDQATDSRSGAVSGSRSDQGNITLDGVDNNDQVQGYAFTGALRSTLDSVEEFRVTTSNATSDAGRSSGAQISMITKSGTNLIHGSAYEYNRNTAAVANNWFNKQAELSQGLPNTPGKLIRNTFGAAIGGPIRKNKIFYFYNYEGQRTAENQQITLTVPTPSLRSGNIAYYDGSGNTVTLNPQQIASMDPGCKANATCAWGPGIDPNSVALFNSYPLPNGYSEGDGLNTASFTWSAPNPASLNTQISKVDYVLSETNRLFVRANLQNDIARAIPQFPGSPPSSVNTSNTKGLAAGDAWSISKNTVNNVRYGVTRLEYADRGVGSGSYVDFAGLTSSQAETRTTIVSVPVQSVVDDMTWVKHAHTLQFGANFRSIHNQSQTNSNSFSHARSNPYALNFGGIANTGQSLDPGAFGFPAVADSFGNSYDKSIMALTGLVNLVSNEYNYDVSPNGTTGTLLGQGSFVNRDFKANEFEYYVQDSWQVKPNLTLSFGLRHSLLQTPYEIHGQQVQPSIDIHDWFQTRGEDASKGLSTQPLFSFGPSGQSRGGKPYWPMQKANIAPRLAIAYSPDPPNSLLRKVFGSAGHSSLRAGFGMYYDHFGQGIVNSFNSIGSFGLSTSVTNEQIFTPDNSPRFTGIHNLPSLNPPPAENVSYPFTPSANALTTGYASTNGIDDDVKTPYSYALDLDVQRELPGGFLLEAAYVGRLGHHLLQQRDLAAPLDLVDPASGVDYFTAATELSKAGYAGQTNINPIAYWEDLFPDAAGGGNSATQNIYNLWTTLLGNETLSLYYLDILCTPGCGGHPNRYWSPQWSSLYAWSSIGVASYDAGQVIIRHPMSHGLQMDVNYTLSKSLDMGSDAERTCSYCANSLSVGGVFGTFSPIINAWNPRQNYAVSDFDTRHIVTGNWVYELPFGEHRTISKTADRLLGSVLGGWQTSGLARWTSGLPFGIISGNNFSTDYNFQSWLVQTAPIKTSKNYSQNGAPEVFASPTAISNGLAVGSPVRNAYPGETGQRNQFRGDGYFGIDAALAKTWKIHERLNAKFAWEVFNVTNSVRFDTNPITSLQNNVLGGQFGVYAATLSASRVQQFSLRLSF